MGQGTKTDEKHLSLDQGVQEFRDALAPQEGQFMRGVSVILNDPKDPTFKPSRGGTSSRSTETLGMPDAERVAAGLTMKVAPLAQPADPNDPLFKLFTHKLV